MKRQYPESGKGHTGLIDWLVWVNCTYNMILYKTRTIIHPFESSFHACAHARANMEGAIKTVVSVYLKSAKGKESLGGKDFQNLVKNQLKNILTVSNCGLPLLIIQSLHSPFHQLNTKPLGPDTFCIVPLGSTITVLAEVWFMPELKLSID